ncbi:hypothetical protein BH23BAC1_BH23BAC1_13500 [soil metagenome]
MVRFDKYIFLNIYKIIKSNAEIKKSNFNKFFKLLIYKKGG